VQKHPISYSSAAQFRRTLRSFEARTQEVCARHGLTAEQYSLLLMIKGIGEEGVLASVSEIADRFNLAHNSVAERLRRAETRGLVRRERAHHDGRVTLIRLTPEGDRRLRATFEDLGEEFDQLVEILSQIEPAPAHTHA
jgi:DNA-binding MarR family transcriptional regulator